MKLTNGSVGAASRSSDEKFTATVLEVLRLRSGTSMRASEVVREIGSSTSEAAVEAALGRLVEAGYVTSEADSSGLQKVLRYRLV